jgi:phosphohistidine phosphatase
MRLYLVQHAESRDKQEDPERSITDEGRGVTEKMAAFAAGMKRIKVKNIFHSGKKRAEETAGILADKIKPAGGVSIADGLKPMDDVGAWADKFGTIKDDTMLVGHLPFMAKLCACLLSGDESKPIVRFTNSGIVCLERDINEAWSLLWAVTPEII